MYLKLGSVVQAISLGEGSLTKYVFWIIIYNGT